MLCNNFGGTYCFYLHGRRVSQAMKNHMDIGRGTAVVGSVPESMLVRIKVQMRIMLRFLVSFFPSTCSFG
jgi:hypothetical protein